MILAQLATEIRYQLYVFRVLYRPIPPAPKLTGAHARPFTIADPYNYPGEYRKAQLHLHTSNSKDVQPKIPVAATIEKYRQRGYQYLVITDHEVITDCSKLNSPDLAVLPGVEETITFLFWPLGRHLVHIAPSADEKSAPGSTSTTGAASILQSKFDGALILPAHPNWQGNLGTGRWYLHDLLQLPNLKLIEIYNHHSSPTADLKLWHQLLYRRGFQNPIWAVAVDDSDNGENIDQGWIMIKTSELTPAALMKALIHGAFYATTGIRADFRAEAGIIQANSENGTRIQFINQQNQIVATSNSNRSQYHPQGDEGFIRIEITNPQGMTAWSQPFFLIPKA
ncbi:MAG TPA: hypothetical protein VHY08_20505 [Bacillota bacterium]|nr:hypothetical protein [Bacillota bacterium]